MLTASATIPVGGAPALLAKLCRHFSEHGAVEFDGSEGRIEQDFGSSRLKAFAGEIAVTVSATDAVNLAYMKLGIAEHVAEMAEAPVAPFAWKGDGAGETAPPFFREMHVVASRRIAPCMQRVTLRGTDLRRFASGGLHMRLVFAPKDRAPVWPVLGADGRIRWPAGPDALAARIYTIRRIDVASGTIDVDIVLHPGAATPGSAFAELAQPGDVVGMMGPGGGFVPQARTVVLFGDETAMPAIARILEMLDPGMRAKAFIETDGAASAQGFDGPAGADVTFLDRNGAPAGTTDLLAEAARGLDWDAIGADAFVWAGCEFAAFKSIRRFVRADLKLARDRHLVVAYWRRGARGDDARTETQ